VIRSFSAVMAVAGVTLLAIGCGGSDRTLVPVTGTVTYNGAAVEGALVTFTNAGITAFDSTDAEGKFSLNTRAGDGAEPGKYTVTVRKFTEVAGPPAATEGASVSNPGPGRMAEVAAAAGEVAQPESLLPEVYGSLQTTPLRDYEVKADGANDFPLVLTDDAAPAAGESATAPAGS